MHRLRSDIQIKCNRFYIEGILFLLFPFLWYLMIDKNYNFLTFIQCIHECFNNDTKKSKITCIYTTSFFIGLNTLFIACFLHAIIIHSNEKTFYCLMKWKCGWKNNVGLITQYIMFTCTFTDNWLRQMF